MVQVDLAFLAVQDFPPAEIFVAFIGTPPSEPKETVTVKFTLPFLTGLLDIAVTVGALGFVADLTTAWAGAASANVKIKARGIEERFMLQEYNHLTKLAIL
jgi:hypothetical protein